MLDTADIDEDGTVSSLLNSKPIDVIADKLDSIQVNQRLEELGYVSPNLNLILTLCSLRGIPIDISFNTRTMEPPTKEEVTRKTVVPKADLPKAPPAHRMFLHKGVGQFTFVHGGEGNKPEQHVLHLDPTLSQHRRMLIEVAKATGAFPVGLKHRILEMPDGKYVQAQVGRMFGMERLDRFKVAVDPDKPFRFVAVDGGAINNEPIGEVDNILEDLFDQDNNGQTKGKPKNFGIIMIDPFPDFETTEEAEGQDSLTTIPFKLFGALRSQAMLKEGDIRRGFRGEDYTRGLIFPSKKDPTTGKPRKYAIACASLDGFGGFLSREFRHHDFLLGRRNCQSFLRKFFTVPEKSPVLGEWTDLMRERCAVQYEEVEGYFYPIIPDLRGWGIENDPSCLQPPADVHITAADVCRFYPALKRRTKRVLTNYFNLPHALYGKKKPKPKMEKDATIRRMINQHTGGFANDFGRWAMIALAVLLLLPLVPVLLFLIVIPLLYLLLINLISGYVARKKVLNVILTDLKAKGLLK
jgi:hypothetical protein